MQKMAIFKRFSRTLRENSTLAKAMNNFAIGGGDRMAYLQAKSGSGMNTFNAIAAESNNKVKVAAQKGSYLSNYAKNSVGPFGFRGQQRHCIHTSGYKNDRLTALGRLVDSLGGEVTSGQIPVYGRYRRERGPKVMPERNRNIRDHKRRLLAAKYELRRKLYKALCQDPELPPAMREKFRMKLSKLPRNSAFTRVRNRCIFTGRGRAIIRKFKMSRICFRTLAGHNQLMGIKKSSW